MPNNLIQPRPSLPPGSLAMKPNLSDGRQYAGANLNRQVRFDARRDRRDGSWGFLEFPRWLLWFNDACFAAVVDDDFECAAGSLVEAPFIDPWS